MITFLSMLLLVSVAGLVICVNLYNQLTPAIIDWVSEYKDAKPSTRHGANL